MLQKLTDSLSTHKWLWYTILGALALVFSAWGAYGIVNLNFGGSGADAAVVDGHAITLQQASNAWLRAQPQIARIYGPNLSASERKKLQGEVLEGLISDTLMSLRTQRLGYRVTQGELIAAIRQVPQFQVNGKYSAQAAEDVLAESGIALPQFEHEIVNQLRRNQLIDGIRSSDFLTPVQIERAERLQSQQRKVQYVLFPAKRYASAAPIAPAAIEAYYKAHRATYMLPESVDLRYGQLTLAQLESRQKVSPAALQAQYQKELAHFVVPQQREASDIVITFGKDPKVALRKAEHIVQLARSGRNFATLARRYSQDPGSAAHGGTLGWMSRTGYDKTFTRALFAIAQVGGITGPVKTRFGYQIIRLDGIRPRHARSFASVKSQLASELRHRLAVHRFGDIEDSLQNDLQTPGVSLAALAKRYGLTTGAIPLFLRGPGAPPLGAAPAVQNLVFGSAALPPGSFGGPIILDNDRMVIIKVLARHGPQLKPLAEVKNSIIATLQAQRANHAALAAAEAARREVLAGKSLQSVAQSLRLKSAPATFIGRDDPSVPTAVGQLAFAAPKPAGRPVYEAKALSDGGAVLLAVTAVRTAPHVNPLLRRALLQQLLRANADGDVVAYMAQMRDTAKVRTNPHAFQ
jgi:peptidyl-prolyl cis-trans isomerase D